MPECNFCGQINPPGGELCRSCGASLPASQGISMDEIRSLATAGKKIEAIKLYRGLTGMGLKEAKDAVEALERGESIVSKSLDESAEVQMLLLLKQGNKIQAIKLYRERTGAGLKDSKEAVEALAAQHGIFISRGPGTVPIVMVLLLALVMAGVVYVLFR